MDFIIITAKFNFIDAHFNNERTKTQRFDVMLGKPMFIGLVLAIISLPSYSIIMWFNRISRHI